jgi:hypothetical protein
MYRFPTLLAAGLLLGLVSLHFSPVNAQAAAEGAEPAFEFDPTVCAEYNDGGALGEECLAMIEAYPRPPAEPIDEDRFTLSYYSFWRVGPEATQKFDGPNGSVVGEIPAGFNFVHAIDTSVEGWLQIEGGEWVRQEDARFTQPSYFTGVTISNDLEYPFAWVLDLSRIFVSEYPGGPWEPDTGRWLERYERVNIFAEAIDEEGWKWYMIGPNQWVEQRFVAKVQRHERPEGVSGHWVAVDLYEQTMVAYEDDTPVFATLVSSGLEHSETEEGLFSVWAELPRDGMSGATGAPDAYALQSVPWVMYFNGGYSLHGTYWHDLFGYRQSHGCVNLSISDAGWLFNWFNEGEPNEDGEIVNDVFIWSSGEYGVTATGL